MFGPVRTLLLVAVNEVSGAHAAANIQSREIICIIIYLFVIPRRENG